MISPLLFAHSLTYLLFISLVSILHIHRPYSYKHAPHVSSTLDASTQDLSVLTQCFLSYTYAFFFYFIFMILFFFFVLDPNNHSHQLSKLRLYIIMTLLYALVLNIIYLIFLLFTLRLAWRLLNSVDISCSPSAIFEFMMTPKYRSWFKYSLCVSLPLVFHFSFLESSSKTYLQ